MKNKRLMLVLLFLMPGTLMAQNPATSQTPHASVTSLTSKDLPELPGKEVLMITVDYPPGSADPIHRHNAHAFIYVLEGSIIMQVKGGKEVTLTPGQTFYEAPTMFMSWVGTQAVPGPQSSSCSSLKTRALRC
jgi:quercetin dioxygenase-like cupin family protein